MPSLPSSRGCRNHCRIHQSIFPCQEAFQRISSCYHLCRCRSIQQTTTPVDARRRLNPSHHCSMEVRNKVRSHSCLLPDTSLQSFHEVLWRCHPVSRHQSVHKISHGNTWLRDSVRRIDVCFLGDFIQEGCAANLADDLYCGGDTPEELTFNWSRIMKALSRCNLRLSAAKTVVCPKSTTILGWIWSQGVLSASPHRITALTSGLPLSPSKVSVHSSAPTRSLAVCFLIAPNS